MDRKYQFILIFLNFTNQRNKYNMNYSISLNIAWQIAAWETAAASLECIDKDMITVGILSLEKIMSGKQNELELDQNQWNQIKAENTALQEVFDCFKLKMTLIRRSLRQAVGTGSFKNEGNVIHRSDDCKKYFQTAEGLAGDSNILNTLHLMAAILSNPSEQIGKVLKEFDIDLAELKYRLIAQANKPVVVTADNSSSLDLIPKSYLNKFGHDLTQDARDGKLFPFIGRQKELAQVINTLARSSKNNPVLVGEPALVKPPW